jgi:hypothetical protein
MGKYGIKFRGKVEDTMDMPPLVEPIEPEPSPAPIPAAICFTKSGGLELKPLQGCSDADVATLSRIMLTTWFLCEPRILKDLIESADDGLARKQ